MKKNKVIVLALSFTVLGCSSSITKNTIPFKSVQSVNKIESDSLDFFPNGDKSSSLEDKYNLRNYLNNNNFLNDISLPQIDDFKVRFTSDGGAVFAIKSIADEITWGRIPKNLLFDYFQLNGQFQEQNETRYYSRYSQLVDNVINVKKDSEFSKKSTLVQTIGISLVEQVNNYKIKGTTPVIIRQVEKNQLPYQIKSVSFEYGNKQILNLADEKIILPWPGININKSEMKKLNVKVVIESKDNNEVEAIIGIQKLQQQLQRTDKNTYSADFDPSELVNEKSGFIIQLIDRKSLENNSKYYGYSWVLPFVVKD